MFSAKTLPFLLLVFILFFVVYAGCRRVDQHESFLQPKNKVERFFNIPAGTDQMVVAVNQNILRQEQKNPFIDDFVTWAGFPLWNKAKVKQHFLARTTDGTDTIEYALIPFEKNSNDDIGAILFARFTPTDTAYQMVYNWQYADYGFGRHSDTAWNAKDIFHLFTVFERDVFGYTKFKILDYRLLGLSRAPRYPINISFGSASMVPNPMAFMISVSCDTYEACYEPSESNSGCPGGGCYEGCQWWLYEETSCTMSVDGVNGGGGGIGGGSNPPGGIGGGGGQGGGPHGGSPPWASNPCRIDPNAPPSPDPCGGTGWTPVLDPNNPSDPIDSTLAKTSRAIQNADSLLTVSLTEPKKEFSEIIVMKDGIIYTKNIHTDNDSTGNYPVWTLDRGEVLLGYIHTHPKYPVSDRSAPSHGDVEGLRYNQNIQNFVGYTECGNVRYAMVIENVPKAKLWLRNNSFEKIGNQLFALAQQQPNWFNNWQAATQAALAQIFGSSVSSGIGFYISNNSTKTTYTKLNP